MDSTGPEPQRDHTVWSHKAPERNPIPQNRTGDGGGPLPNPDLRQGVHHLSMGAAVISLAVLFGAVLGLLVRWLSH